MNQVTDLNPVSTESDYDSLNDLFTLNELVADKYHRHLVEDILSFPEHPATRYVRGQRNLTDDQIKHWNLGYAPENWRFVTDAVKILDAVDTAIAIGVCRQKENRHYDAFNKRLMLPIYTEEHRIAGFSGRLIGEETNKQGDKLPKYINTAQTVIFRKEELFFGLNRAQREIKKTSSVTLTEGPFDVISLHRAGLTNAIGKQGSALTQLQIKWLVENCEVVTLIYDVDPNESGQKALEKDLEALLWAGLRVKVFRLPQPEVEVAEGEQEAKPKLVKVDADSWVQSFLINRVDGPACKLPDKNSGYLQRFGKLDLTKLVKEESVDGLMDLATRWLSVDDIDDQITGQKHLVNMLANVREDSYVDAYIERLAKSFTWNKRSLTKSVSDARKKKKGQSTDEDTKDKMPEWVDVKDFYAWGLAERCDKQLPEKTGYYFPGYSGISPSPVTNFIIRPLYLIKEQGHVRRLVEFDNGYRKEFAELDSKVLTGMTQFEQMLTDLGYYTVEEEFERKHLKRIVNKLLANTPSAFPVRTLGWQPEGFFAFSNAVFNGHLANYNEYGIVQVGEQSFFSPSLSPINRSYRQEDDAYKHDRYLSWRTTEVTFKQWSHQLRVVYGERAMVGVTFIVAALFKDIVKKYAKIPLIYLYGPKDSGKSTFAESLLYVFFSGKDSNGDLMKPMNLGAQPTLAAFWTAMARYRNCPFVFNEFDDQRVERFVPTAFKAAWDNEGRSRQSKDNKYQTEEQTVNCAPIIVGQYLTTGDDGAVLSRSLVFEFHNRKDDPFTPEEVKQYTQLRQWEQAGLNGLLGELLPLRPKLEKEFAETFRLVSTELYDDLEKRGMPYETRSFQNVACLLTIYDLLASSISWPMSRLEFWSYGRKLIEEMKSQIHESDVLTGFWSMLEYLLDRGDITEGWDFKIDTTTVAKLTGSNGKQETLTFEKPVRVLYLRMGIVHKPYAESVRKQSAEKPHSETTLTAYIRQQKYYLGKNDRTYFSKAGGINTNTNALVLNYDLLSERTDISLERFQDIPDEEKLPPRTLTGSVAREVKLHTLATGPKVEFALQVTEVGTMKTEQYNVKCFVDESRIDLSKLSVGSRWKVLGSYSEKPWKHGTEQGLSRQLDVLTAECLDQSVTYSAGHEPIEKGQEGF
jgi:DNA primase